MKDSREGQHSPGSAVYKSCDRRQDARPVLTSFSVALKWAVGTFFQPAEDEGPSESTLAAAVIASHQGSVSEQLK